MNLRSVRFRLGILCAVTFCGVPDFAAAQVSPILGASFKKGTAQRPFYSSCAGDPDGPVNSTALYGGIGVGPFSATAEYTEARPGGGIADCVIPNTPDGVHRVRQFTRRISAYYGWAFNFRFSPASLPLMAYVGTGFEHEGDEFRTLGVALRTHGRLSVIGGVEVTHLRTPFRDVDQAWQDQQVVTFEVVDSGQAWRRLEVVRIGLEYRFGLFGG